MAGQAGRDKKNMSLAEPQRSQRDHKGKWTSPKNRKKTDVVSNVFRLISFSEINPLRVSASSSEAGEIKKIESIPNQYTLNGFNLQPYTLYLQSRRAHRKNISKLMSQPITLSDRTYKMDRIGFTN